MSHDFHRPLKHVLWALIASFGMGQAALADPVSRAAQAPLLPQYKAECASCHLAYPPGMLPAASWQRLMSNLQRHFGTDASVDAAAAKELSAWLSANAGTDRRVRDAPPEDRITRSAWFIREHHEVSAATWQRPAIKGAANCAACHTRADQGDFSERSIRIPR